MYSMGLTIGVAGLGLLGRGIAACCLAHGFRVVGYTQPDQPHEKAYNNIEHAISELNQRAGFDSELKETIDLFVCGSHMSELPLNLSLIHI